VLLAIFVIALVALIILTVLGMARTYGKAGKPPWAIIVPIFNVHCMVKMAQKSGWWTLAICIPYIGWLFSIPVYTAVARRFGKNDLFGIGLLFLPFICFPILAFGKAVYTPEGIYTPLEEVFA